MSANSRFLLFYFIFVALVFGGLWLWNSNSAASQQLVPVSWYMLGFFAAAYLGSHFFIQSTDDKKPAVFVRRFMATSALRLFLFIIIIVAYAFTHKATATVFIFHFLFFYLAFTALEVATLYRHFRRPANS